MKRILAFLLLAVLLLGLLAPAAYADEEETTAAAQAEEKPLGGWMEQDFYWELENGTLTLTGDGVNPGGAPWRDYSSDIRKIVFSDGVLTVDAGSFRNCENLEEVVFGSNMQEIGDYAFQGCTSLKEIRLPDTFRYFGASCFAGCTSLRQVYCDGYMPRFSDGCLWNEDRIYVYYSSERAWKEKDMEPLERVYGGRLEFMCQDGTDPIANDEDDPEPLAPVALATEPPVTEPPVTEPPTVPTTVATEPPVVTVPETTVPETTIPETIPEPATEETSGWAPTAPTEPTEEENTARSGFIGLAMIVGVLTFFIVGALIFKIRSSRGGRY